MEITYTQIGDYLYPNITLGEDDKLPIGKYGRMRKEYLREHREKPFILCEYTHSMGNSNA